MLNISWLKLAGLWLAAGASLLPANVLAQTPTGWTAGQQARRLEQYSRLKATEVSRSTAIMDDGLEIVAILSTEPAYHFRGGFSDRVRADSFLRALIDKRSRQIIFQLYEHLVYSGERRELNSVNVETSEELVTLRVESLGYHFRCPYGVCLHEEDIAFVVSESLLREIAARAEQRPVRPWQFRFKANNGLDWTDDMAPAEAAGLISRVAQWQLEHPAP